MNPIFQKLLQNSSGIRPFLEWYVMKYKTIEVFQHLPFTHQIGVYLEYFEEIYSLVVLVSHVGYKVQFKDKRNMIQVNPEYNHHRFTHSEPKSIIYGYELAIFWLFENFDLPF